MKYHQGGWLLLEALLATVIGFFILAAATQFFFSSTGNLAELVQQWYRLGQYEKWRLWLHDLLDTEQAKLHCGEQERIAIERIEKDGFSLHTCRLLSLHWQWASTRYYLRKKGDLSYLYEKTADQPGVAWIPGVIGLQAKQTAPVKQGCTGLVVDWQSDSAHQSDLSAHFYLGWCSEKPAGNR